MINESPQITHCFQCGARFCLLITVFHLFLSMASAQGQHMNDLNYAPTTPEVASIGKFAETPVGLYTGIPDISIPIETVSSGSLAVPITLRYHAGGIRVEETASWVGLGWSLSAGGSVTRVIRGIADDASGGFLNSHHSVDAFLAIPNTPENRGVLVDLMQQAIDGDLDYEPDVFHYSLPGFSGSFFFTQSGEYITMPHVDIRILAIKDDHKKIIGWKMTTPNGVMHYLGLSKDKSRSAHEKLLLTRSYGGGKNHSKGSINGWGLLDIEDAATKNRIRLSYESNLYTACVSGGQQRYINKTGESNEVTNGIKPLAYFESYISSSKLTSVEGSSTRVEFVKNTSERMDLPGDYALNQILVRDINGKELKRFGLTQEFRGQDGQDPALPCSGIEGYYRMFLTGVQEIHDDEAFPPFQLHYNNKPLPHRFSFAKDFWGFYNGKVNNQHLIPTATYEGTYYQGSNRAADPSYSVAGILEKIIFPTGGYTIFEYEGNTTTKAAFASQLAPRSETTIVTVSTQEVVSSASPRMYEKAFHINNNEVLNDTILIDVNLPCDISDRTCGVRVFLTSQQHPIPISLNSDTTLQLLDPSGDTFVIHVSLTPDDFGSYPDFSVRIYGEKVEETYDVGGLRVKSVKNYSNTGDLIQKSYAYHQFDNVDVSSGSMTSSPVFIESDRLFQFQGGGSAYVDIIHSSSTNPMTTTQGGTIGYSQVTEFFGTPGDNTGKKEYEFSFNVDGDSGTEFPYPPAVSFEWLRGLPEKERVYRLQGSEYEIVSEVENIYQYHRGSTDLFRKEVTGVKVGGNAGFYAYAPYLSISEWLYLSRTISSQHFGNNLVKTVTEYGYHEDPSRHVLPIEKVVWNHDQDAIHVHTKYPDDLVAKSAAEQKLIDQFRINTPIHVIQSRVQGNQTTLISKTATVYTFQENSLVLPASKTSTGASGLTIDEVIYHKYDNKGNVVEVSKANGVHVCYVWGYQQSFPIAKVENATFADVAPYVDHLLSLSNADASAAVEADLRAALGLLRAGLSQAQVTTYTYDPPVGVTSITDPRGQTVFYHYDAFNRLQHIVDAEDHVISTNRYHYKN